MDFEELKKELKEKGTPIYSFSRLSLLHNCLKEYEFNYLNNPDIDTNNIWSKIGSLIHSCCEDIYNGTMKQEDFQERYLNGYKEIIEAGYKFPNETIENNLRQCVGHYIDNFKKEEYKCENEKYFLVEINGIWIQGYIDKIIFNDDGTIDIHDYKVSSEFKKEDLKHKGMQLALYAYAMESLGYKVRNIAWNMFKYCNIKFNIDNVKRKPLSARNKLWDNKQKPFLKACKKIGMEDNEAFGLWIEYCKANTVNIDERLKEYINIEDGIVPYPYNEETKNDLLEFISSSMDLLNKTKEFKPLTITQKNSFYCSNICGYRNMCDAYRDYINNLPDNRIVDMFDGDNTVKFEDFFR